MSHEPQESDDDWRPDWLFYVIEEFCTSDTIRLFDEYISWRANKISDLLTKYSEKEFDEGSVYEKEFYGNYLIFYIGCMKYINDVWKESRLENSNLEELAGFKDLYELRLPMCRPQMNMESDFRDMPRYIRRYYDPDFKIPENPF